MHKVATSKGDVSAVVEGPEGAPTLLLAHGAGAGMDHAFMEEAASDLAARGVRVWRFNFPYTEAGRRAPDKAPVLEDAFRSVAGCVREREGPSRLVLGGKSMGGRIAAHLAAAGEPCEGLVFLGYPMHPPGKPERLRDEPLRGSPVPMLFVEGDRDPFCPLSTLEEVRRGLSVPTEVHVVDDGDHSFNVRRASGRSSREARAEAFRAVADWVARL